VEEQADLPPLHGLLEEEAQLLRGLRVSSPTPSPAPPPSQAPRGQERAAGSVATGSVSQCEPSLRAGLAASGPAAQVPRSPSKSEISAKLDSVTAALHLLLEERAEARVHARAKAPALATPVAVPSRPPSEATEGEPTSPMSEGEVADAGPAAAAQYRRPDVELWRKALGTLPPSWQLKSEEPLAQWLDRWRLCAASARSAGVNIPSRFLALEAAKRLAGSAWSVFNDAFKRGYEPANLEDLESFLTRNVVGKHLSEVSARLAIASMRPAWYGQQAAEEYLQKVEEKCDQLHTETSVPERVFLALLGLPRKVAEKLTRIPGQPPGTSDQWAEWPEFKRYLVAEMASHNGPITGEPWGPARIPSSDDNPPRRTGGPAPGGLRNEPRDRRPHRPKRPRSRDGRGRPGHDGHQGRPHPRQDGPRRDAARPPAPGGPPGRPRSDRPPARQDGYRKDKKVSGGTGAPQVNQSSCYTLADHHQHDVQTAANEGV